MEQETLKQQVRRLTKPIFNKILKESSLNSRTTIKDVKYLWQPHNYRYKKPYKREIRKVIALKKVLLKLQASGYNINNLKYTEHTKKYTLKEFKGVTLEVNPKSIIAIYSNRSWYLLEAYSIDDVNKALKNRVEEIHKICLNAIQEFAKLFGLKRSLDTGNWIRHEDKIKGDDYLDKIPKEFVIHDTSFKKVYRDTVEFSSPLHVKNYINNRALEMVAPKIAEALVNNTGQLKEWTDAVHLEIKNKKLHMKVLNNMSKSLKNIDKSLEHKTLFKRVFG